MSRLTETERSIAYAVNQIAFTNPFSDERAVFDAQVAEEVTRFARREGPVSRKSSVADWVDQLPEAKWRYQAFQGEDAELIRVAFLFAAYDEYLSLMDGLIENQLKHASSLKAAFLQECMEFLREHGFNSEESCRYVAVFYQLRRAHHFIVRGLRGVSPCMKEFRRRLWNNLFTSDVRWYDQFLWNRMEDFSTLLLGPSGTGKGTAAAALGRSGFIPFEANRSEFAENFNNAFISLNLAQFPETLLEAELFGYRKGAFTGAVEAHQGIFARCSRHGSIFLDEIGEVGAPVQVKLLNVLQERSFSPVGSREKLRFNGRVIAATNKTLGELREGKLFRDDFFYRISSDVVVVPSLQERLRETPQEMDLLLETILVRLTGQKTLVGPVRDRLARCPGPDYPWPGNVRELEQAVRRILITGCYEPGRLQDRDKIEGLRRRLESIDFTAEELLREYCRLAHQQLHTRAEVGRKLQLDPRTVQKYL